MDLPSLPSFGIPNLPTPNIPVIPTLAQGTFSGGASDDVATADVYKITSAIDGAQDSVITSIQDLELEINEKLLDVKLAAGDAADFLKKVGQDLQFDAKTLTDRLLGTNSEFRDMYNGLNDKLKQGAMLKTYAQKKASALVCTINDTKSMVNSAKISDIRSLGNFINKYTGTKIFSGQDKGAISGLLGSVITTASDLGISGAFKSIADTITDNGILGRVTRAVLPIALRNSDTKMLRDLASSNAGKLINVFSPGFTQSFSKAFVYRGDRGQTLTSFEDIFHSFENVDSTWDLLQRGGDGNSAVNLLALVGASNDFSNLLMTGVRYWATEQSKGNNPPVRVQGVYGLASVYREVTVGEAIKRDFPAVALLSQYNEQLPKQDGNTAGSRSLNNNNTIDPRLVKGSLAALLGL